jgi:hypothetical protein
MCWPTSEPIESDFNVVTHLLELDGQTGALNGNQVELSTPVSLNNGNGDIGLFAGYGRVVLHTGSRVYSIFVPSGIVEDLGYMDSPDHAYSENWAYWGVAEFFNNAVWLVYTRDPGGSLPKSPAPVCPTGSRCRSPRSAIFRTWLPSPSHR